MLIRPIFRAGAARAAWESAAPRCREMLQGRVTVIINDHTRPAVTRALIEPVRDLLDGRSRVLVAPGTHRGVSAAEKDALLPGSAPAVLEGNPVHEDMAEAARMLEKSIPVIMAGAVVRGLDGLFCCAGALVETFSRCVAAAREHLCVPVGKPVGCLLLRPGGGLGVSVYQSMKAVYNFESAVGEGGILLDSPCPEELGSPSMEEVLIESMKPGAENLDRPYRLGMIPVDDPVRFAASFGGDLFELDDAGTLAPLITAPGAGLTPPMGVPVR